MRTIIASRPCSVNAGCVCNCTPLCLRSPCPRLASYTGEEFSPRYFYHAAVVFRPAPPLTLGAKGAPHPLGTPAAGRAAGRSGRQASGRGSPADRWCRERAAPRTRGGAAGPAVFRKAVTFGYFQSYLLGLMAELRRTTSPSTMSLDIGAKNSAPSMSSSPSTFWTTAFNPADSADSGDGWCCTAPAPEGGP